MHRPRGGVSAELAHSRHRHGAGKRAGERDERQARAGDATVEIARRRGATIGGGDGARLGRARGRDDARDERRGAGGGGDARGERRIEAQDGDAERGERDVDNGVGIEEGTERVRDEV